MVYLDSAASTPVDVRVWEEILKYKDIYGNPSSIHKFGQEAGKLIENSRQIIADYIKCKPNEIIFTASGTEANNLALIGYAKANKNKGKHIISCVTEHASVLKPLESLYDCGYDVTLLHVDEYGYIDLNDLERAVRRDTILVSIMQANNEISTIMPIRQIGEICKYHNIMFHSDCVAGLPHIPIDVNELNLDMASFSGHKIHSVKGCGVLYARDSINIQPIITGGPQEYNLRAGTENVPGIIGIGKAVELLQNLHKLDLLPLKTKLINGIKENISGVKFNGDIENGLPSIINFSITGIDGYSLVTALSERGIYVSQGSACNSVSLAGSHVVKAISNTKTANEAVRVSCGRYTTLEDIEYFLKILPQCVADLKRF